MDPCVEPADVTTRRSVFTWKELAVALVISGVAAALIIPAITASREDGRRDTCKLQLKQLGLALHNYAYANKVFPPGTICSTKPIQPHNQYDVWAEAAKLEQGFHGTSFLLRILPFCEMDGIFKQWDYRYGVAYNAGREDGAPWPGQEWSRNGAIIEYRSFYCPSRRTGLRPQDHAMMLAPWWTGGGTDYGGCAGRHAAFTNETGYNLCNASSYYEPSFLPNTLKSQVDDTEVKRWGIFGRVNVSTRFSDITDGVANTIMTGELQRITTITPGSKDGWAIGGPATLFTTGALIHFDGKKCANVVPPTPGKLMNNMFWGSPGSEHPDGANYGMADGSVRFIPTSIDTTVFALAGSMADRRPVAIPENSFLPRK